MSNSRVTRQKPHFRCKGLLDRYYCDFSGGISSWQKNASSDKPFHLVFWCWETEPRNCWEIHLIHKATISRYYFGFLYLTRICWNNILDLLVAHLWSLTRSCKWPLFFTALFAYIWKSQLSIFTIDLHSSFNMERQIMLNNIWVAIMFLPKSHTNIYLASPRIKKCDFCCFIHE